MSFRNQSQDKIYEDIIYYYSRNLHEKLYQLIIQADYTVVNTASRYLTKKYKRKPGQELDLESWWEKYNSKWYHPSSRSYSKAKEYFKHRRLKTAQAIKKTKSSEKKQDLLTREKNLKLRREVSYKAIKKIKIQKTYQRKIQKAKKIQTKLRKNLTYKKVKIPKHAKIRTNQYQRLDAQLKAYKKSIRILRKIFRLSTSRKKNFRSKVKEILKRILKIKQPIREKCSTLLENDNILSYNPQNYNNQYGWNNNYGICW